MRGTSADFVPHETKDATVSLALTLQKTTRSGTVFTVTLELVLYDILNTIGVNDTGSLGVEPLISNVVKLFNK